MESPYYRTEAVCPGVTRIRCRVGEMCYLVEGSERAVLIDTASGYRGLPELAAELTSLPVTVVLTHGHRDHAGGAALFPQVYAHMGDWDLLEQLTDEEFRTGYPKALKPKRFAGLGTEEFPRLYETEFLPLANGQRFELGDTSLEVWETPGHTTGSVCLYDTARRILFAGDTVLRCALLVFEQSLPVAEYLSTLQWLYSRREAFDHVYGSHFEGEVPEDGMERLMDCCREILAGEDEHVPSRMFRRDCFAAHRPAEELTLRADGQWGNIFYK